MTVAQPAGMVEVDQQGGATITRAFAITLKARP